MEADIYLGQGIYPIWYAAHLAQAPSDKFRRWVSKYKESEPVHRPSFPKVDQRTAVNFLDLMELFAVQRFRDSGVSMQKIRLAADRMRRERNINHPLADERLRTDGRDIFLDLEGVVVNFTGKPLDQIAFKDIIEPFLDRLEFSKNHLATRYYPLGKEGLIVIDPEISFGKPVIRGTGIPTEIIWEQICAGDSIDVISHWYRLTIDQVNAVAAYEKALARAS